MIKLEDVIAVTEGYIAIMNGLDRSIVINTYRLGDSALSYSLLGCKVRTIRAKDDTTLIWLEGYGD